MKCKDAIRVGVHRDVSVDFRDRYVEVAERDKQQVGPWPDPSSSAHASARCGVFQSRQLRPSPLRTGSHYAVSHFPPPALELGLEVREQHAPVNASNSGRLRTHS